MKLKIRNMNNYIFEVPFKLLYLVFAFFTYCNITYSRPIMSVVVDMILGLGALTILFRIFNLKRYIKTKGLMVVVLFLISYFISMIANYQYGISDNFKYLIWTSFHFFVFYACDVDRDVKEYRKEFNIISWFFIIVMFILSSCSILMYYRGISIEIYNQQGGVFLAGVVWGRLWGTFTDPNYASVFATISIVFSYFKFKNVKTLPIRMFLTINIIVQMMYIAFSDSRTGVVCVFSCTFIYTLLIGLKFFKVKRISYPVIIVSSLAIAVILAAIPVGIKHANNAMRDYTEMIVEDSEEELKIGRADDLENNFSNRRFELWSSAIEIVETKPIVGVSFFNIVPYAQKNTPKTYLVNNDHGVFNNFHNMPFNVLVGQGILGFMVVLVTAILLIVYIFKHLFNAKAEDFEYLVILVTSVAASAVSSIFLTDIYYVNSPTSLVFWLFLGYLVHYFKRMCLDKV